VTNRKKSKSKRKTANRQPISVLDEVRAFVAGQKQLRKALKGAEAHLRQCEAEADEARLTLAQSEAQSWVATEQGTMDDTPQSQSFVTAMLKLEKARAAVGGITKRIAEADAGLLSASEKMRAERERYNAEQITGFLERDFKPAAAQFAAVLQCGLAIEEALGVELPEMHTLPDAGNWKENGDATALNKATREHRVLSEAIEEFRRDAEHRVMLAEKSRQQRAGFDPGGKYQVIRPFMCYGMEFEQGQIVDATKFHTRLLGQLYEAKRLRLLERKDEWTL